MSDTEFENETIGSLATELAALKKEIEKQKAELEWTQKAYDARSLQLLNLLEASNMDSFNAHGLTFYSSVKESVRIPKDDEAKQQFYTWLKEQGLFDSMISVNSQTLNSLYKAKSEEALKAGILEFRIPGIEEATTYKQLRIRKG